MSDDQADRAAIDRVRAFNRTVTARIGALEDEYLGSARSLGASRVLWEVRDEGVDVREIRERLQLDSGYLSRLLRALEREGLVGLEASAADSRVRTARTTAAGRAERADTRSDRAIEGAHAVDRCSVGLVVGHMPDRSQLFSPRQE